MSQSPLVYKKEIEIIKNYRNVTTYNTSMRLKQTIVWD